jgi:hypothetical protein
LAVLPASIVENVPSDSNHPRELASNWGVVESPPGHDEDLFDEVVDLVARQRIRATMEVLRHLRDIAVCEVAQPLVSRRPHDPIMSRDGLPISSG